MQQRVGGFRYSSILTKHVRVIINDMVNKGLIERFEEPWGNKTIIKYKVSEKRKSNPSRNTGAI
jgi:hypothetical protein